jgi:hypothetical protein
MQMRNDDDMERWQYIYSHPIEDESADEDFPMWLSGIIIAVFIVVIRVVLSFV